MKHVYAEEIPLYYIYIYIFMTRFGDTTDGTTTLRHTGHVTTHYMINHPFDLYFR
jgi:hypothetical protein